MIDHEHRPEHWRLTARFGLVVLLVTLLIMVLVPLFAGLLDQFSFLRLPLGFYITAQALILIPIAVVFWFSGRQEQTDRRYGATED